jgi:glycosyltransferase involved in cell wall biosynthesis
MRILVLNVQIPYVNGGAEVLAEELDAALKRAGHISELVRIPFNPSPPERIPEQMLACRLIDVTSSFGSSIDRVIGLKFPAYLVPHPNKVLWLLHQHRQAYDLWDNPRFPDLELSPMGSVVRDAIREADRRLIPEAGQIYTISRNVSNRLEHYCRIGSAPLYPPVRGADQFFCGEDKGYLLFPSRLSAIKRQNLVMQALALTREPVRIRFAGTPDHPDYGMKLEEQAEKLKISERVEFLGHVPEEVKRDLYAYARGVVFTPVDEDYGYITLEAMLASKPVITCSDSGGPLEFVHHRQTGLVAEPTPQSLAAAMDELWSSPGLAKQWGEAGRAVYDSLNITWENVVEKLLS